MKRLLIFSAVLALFLVACEQATSPETTVSIPTAVAGDGATIYAQNCAACHGTSGGGAVGPALTHLGDHSDEELIQIITEGRPDQGMPPWGNRLSGEEIAALVEYLRSLEEEGAAGHEEEPSAGAPVAGNLDLTLSLDGGELLAKATLLDSQGHPVVGQEVTFNLQTAVGGILPLGTARTGEDGVAEFRYDPGEAPRVNIEASYQSGEGQEAVSAQGEMEIASNQEIPPISPGLYSPVPPLFAIAILGTVIGAVWLTYAWVGWQLLGILRTRGGDKKWNGPG